MIGVILVVLGFLLPPIAERVATAQIQTLASERGLDVEWGELHWGVADLTVFDVRAKKGRAAARVEEVSLDLTPFKYLTGGSLVDGLHFHKPVFNLQMGSGQQDPATPVGHAAEKASPSWPAWLRRVSVDSAKLQIHQDARLMATMHGDEVSVVMNEDRLIARGAGRMTAVGVREPVDLNCEMDLASDLTDGDAQCDGNAGLPIRLSSVHGALEVMGLSATLSGVDGAVEVTARDLRLQRGTLSGEFGEISLQRRDGANRVRLADGVVRLQRTQSRREEQPEQVLGRRRSLRDVLRGGHALLERLGALSGLFSYMQDIHWERVRVETPWFPRITGMNGKISGDNVQLQAVIAGGRIRAEIDWLPGWAALQRVHMTSSGVQLGPVFARRLPALAPGRSAGGRVDGELSGRLDLISIEDGANGDFIYDADLSWLGGRVELAAVAEQPITGIALRLASEGELSISESVLTTKTEINLGALSATAHLGIADWPDEPKLEVRVAGESLPCEAAIAALPKNLLGPYQRVAATGTFAPKVRLTWPLRRPKEIKLKFRDVIRSCRISRLNTDPVGHPSARLPHGTQLTLDDVAWLNRSFILGVREGVEGGAEIEVGPGTKDYVPLAELPAYVGAAAYLSEEIHFYRNRPIDPGLVGRALRLNLEHGRFVYGGSTVTQQLVKNLFLTRTKTLARKLQEILVAARITHVVSRQRVLELYLNCIEFGPNIFGIARAARYYFQKDARQLTPREAVFLAMLKPAPRRGGSMKRRGHTPRMPYWGYRATEIMERLVDKGYLTQGQMEAEKPYSIEWEQGRYLGRNL